MGGTLVQLRRMVVVNVADCSFLPFERVLLIGCVVRVETATPCSHCLPLFSPVGCILFWMTPPHTAFFSPF